MDHVCHQLQAMDDQAQEEQGAAVLRLLLQHDSARCELRVVSRLLCVSKELAAAVAEHCAGQLALEPTCFYQALHSSRQELMSWLRKHARLAQALDLSTYADWMEPVMTAGPHNLRLQSLVAVTNTALPLLEQLPARFLTCLVLEVTGAPSDEPDGARYAARVSAALGKLTALRSLQLVNEECDLCLPGLSALSNLTWLDYRGWLPLQQMPGQLLELAMQLASPPGPSSLDLRHLTALTSLEFIIGDKRSKCLWEGDLLPPNLRRLKCHCRSVLPLLPLQQLQHLNLELQDTDFTTSQLLGWSNLTMLDVSYKSSAAVFLYDQDLAAFDDQDFAVNAVAPAGAVAWPLLPLKQLRLEGASLAPAICQALAQATGLTSLRLRACVVPGGPPELAAVLSSLSGLCDLQLMRLSLPAQEQPEDVSQLVQAIGSLTRLQQLHVRGVQHFAALGCSSVLAPLSAVTELKLADCDLSDGFVSGFPCLPELRGLDLSDNKRLTDAGLLAVVPQVQQLTSLALVFTGVTDAGLLHLTSLTRLRQLHVGAAVGLTSAGARRLYRLLPGLTIDCYV